MNRFKSGAKTGHSSFAQEKNPTGSRLTEPDEENSNGSVRIRTGQTVEPGKEVEPGRGHGIFSSRSRPAAELGKLVELENKYEIAPRGSRPTVKPGKYVDLERATEDEQTGAAWSPICTD